MNSSSLQPQRRGLKIAMTSTEVDDFLSVQRTCRIATVGAEGRPHVMPVWFVWDGSALWVSSVVRSQRWTDLARDPRIAVVVDAGHDYDELRGVEIQGVAEVVGDVPRLDTPDERLRVIEQLFARKYLGRDEPLPPDGRHAWLRITPRKVTSWDFRKLEGLG